MKNKFNRGEGITAFTSIKLKTNSKPTRRDPMSKNNINNTPAQPVYIMQPQPQQNSDIFNGLGGIVLSAIAGLLLGQFGGGIGFPKLPKL